MKGKQFQRFFCRFVKGCHAMTWLDIISFLIQNSYENIEFLISNELKNHCDIKNLENNLLLHVGINLVKNSIVANLKYLMNKLSIMIVYKKNWWMFHENKHKKVNSCEMPNFTFTCTIKFAFVFDGNNGHVTWFSTEHICFYMIDRQCRTQVWWIEKVYTCMLHNDLIWKHVP